jgi:hypothetical protein
MLFLEKEGFSWRGLWKDHGRDEAREGCQGAQSPFLRLWEEERWKIVDTRLAIEEWSLG